MKKMVIKTIILILLIFFTSCNKKDVSQDIYKFVIQDIDADEYIKCDYGKQKNGEKYKKNIIKKITLYLKQ